MKNTNNIMNNGSLMVPTTTTSKTTTTTTTGGSANASVLSTGSNVLSMNPISYNPISNLALQYYNDNEHKSWVTVLIEVPTSCQVPGGLERLLKTSSTGIISSSSNNSNSLSSSSSSSGLSKWKQVAKNQLEKVTLRGQMETLMSVGAYYRCSTSGEWKCGGMTNWTSFKETTFSIPLILQSNIAYQWQLHYKVDYSKNNVSALFGKRSHPIATSTIHFAPSSYGTHTIPMHNPHTATLPTTTTTNNSSGNASLKVVVVPYHVVVPEAACLTDPIKGGWNNSSSSSSSSLLFHHHPVLSQRYVYDENAVVATERSMESTVVLPMATAMSFVTANAMRKSQDYYQLLSESMAPVTNTVQARRRGHAHVRFGVLEKQHSHLKIYWQSPQHIFEVPLPLKDRKLEFYPSLHTDPSQLLPGTQPPKHHSYYLGSLRIQFSQPQLDLADLTNGLSLDTTHITPANYSSSSSKHNKGNNSNTMVWEAKLALEDYLEHYSSPTNSGGMEPPTTYSVPLTCVSHTNNNNSAQGKVLYFQLTVDTLLHMTTADSNISCENPKMSYGGGLLGLTNTLWNFFDLHPHVEPPNLAGNQAVDRRQRQLQTMGSFFSFGYLHHFAHAVCSVDAAVALERQQAYHQALLHPHQIYDDLEEPIYKRKHPRPFRPSSSRLDALLTGIGFNIHVQSLSLQPTTTNTNTSLPTCINITCGAPADHCRGFSSNNNSNNNSSSHSHGSHSHTLNLNYKVPSGGLRRWIRHQQALEGRLQQSIQSLIATVGQTFAKTSSRHLCGDGNNIGLLLQNCQLQVQYLHRLTWDIAVRKSNVFSQASTIAITAYLAHVTHCTPTRAQLYANHGFLLVFKGLLSTAGKELGMIEDASVGIAMLRQLHITLCPDTITMTQYLTNKSSSPSQQQQPPPILPIPESNHLKWLHLTTEYDTSTKNTKFMAYVGLDPSYYQHQLPKPLQNNVAVQLFPLLYQMGVDIRQWGANITIPTSNNKSTTNNNNNNLESDNVDTMLEDEEEEEDAAAMANFAANNDVLVQLNMEAFWKMNAYAHNSLGVKKKYPFERPSNQIDPIHPQLVDLYELIRFSAGKMEHDILDEAAALAIQLGGASAIFCKSGKDRTAMQVTYQQAQHLIQNSSTANANNNTMEKTLWYATIMRIYGTRLPICEKNVGQSLFAFNSLQSKFMPTVLKPPPRTLAGFLKGGRVFSREGAIET